MNHIIIPKFDSYVRNETDDIRLSPQILSRRMLQGILMVLSRRMLQGILMGQGFCFSLRDNTFFGITTIIAEGLRIVYNNEATSKKPASKKFL